VRQDRASPSADSPRTGSDFAVQVEDAVLPNVFHWLAGRLGGASSCDATVRTVSMRLPLWAVGLSLLLLLGCQKKAEATAEETDTAEEETPDGGEHGDKKEGAKEGEKPGDTASAAEHARNQPKQFAVPFAWEASADEPLARTRAFLRDVVRDNEINASRGKKYFEAFAQKQAPRVTVLTCSDSRVQTQAWDATPDNDDFQIRNIGNQLQNSQGSVEYGIEHLRTPLLLIIGHTGCGAVKAAMGDIGGLSEPIRKELAGLELPKDLKSAEPSNSAWAEAVVANVHAQVQGAVGHFNREVAEQKLTVVGAVYDFRGDLGVPGTLHLVNVNANIDPERLAAFTKAVGGHVRNELGSDDPTQGLLARVAEAARAMAAGHGHQDRATHAAKPTRVEPAANGETETVRAAVAAEALAARAAPGESSTKSEPKTPSRVRSKPASDKKSPAPKPESKSVEPKPEAKPKTTAEKIPGPKAEAGS